MYDNIGGKIKGLAKVMCAVGSIAPIIAGIVIISLDRYGRSTPIAIAVMVLGIISAWVSTWLLYGFGQLIENSDIIAEEYKRANKKATAKKNERIQKQYRKEANVIIANPDADEDTFIDIICPNCNEQVSYTKGQLQGGKAVVCPMCDESILLK